MEWITENWVWIVVGGLFIGMHLFGHGGHGGHAGGHGGLLGGAGHGGHGGDGAGHGDHGGRQDAQAVAGAPEATVDPVGGEAVRTAQALTSVYQGKIYYFASKENRDRFEAAPQEYAHQAAGHAVRPAEAADEPPRRRGCC